MPPLASTSYILALLTVSAGRGIRNQKVVTPQIVTAAFIILLGLMLINGFNSDLAGVFALLLFISTFMVYGPDLLGYVGFNLEAGSE